jgi:hypothetical protein
MSLIERDPTTSLQVPAGVEVVPELPDIASGDARPMWQIMGYESLEDMDSALFPDEIVDEIVRAQQQRVESARSVNIRRARLYPETGYPIGAAALIGSFQRAVAFQAALQVGVDAGRVHFLFDDEL